MATVTGTITANSPNYDMVVFQWTGLTGGDVGSPMAYSNLADKTVQVSGTIGAAITIQGTNDIIADTAPASAVWTTMTDNLGAALSFTTAGIALIAQAPLRIRPSCAAGTTDAKVVIVANVS